MGSPQHNEVDLSYCANRRDAAVLPTDRPILSNESAKFAKTH